MATFALKSFDFSCCASKEYPKCVGNPPCSAITYMFRQTHNPQSDVLFCAGTPALTRTLVAAEPTTLTAEVGTAAK